MRKLATVQFIKGLKPIPGADRIEVATILGWEVVVKKGEFEIGQPCVYIEVDSKVPEKPEYEFLRSKGFKIRTIKLKSQVSQGLALPLNVLDSKKIYIEGDDVTEILGIINYKDNEETKDPQSKQNKFMSFLYRHQATRWIPGLFIRKTKADFPDFIRKTDQDRIQNRLDFYDKMNEFSQFDWICTEKVDGQSASFAYKRSLFGKFFVCSRNMHLIKNDGSNWWKIAQKYDIERKFKKLNKNIYIQGEIIGPGIQGNKYKQDELRFIVFNAYDLDTKKYFTMEELDNLANYLCTITAPIVKSFQELPNFIYSSEEFVPKFVEFSKGKSQIHPDVTREGIVVRLDDPDRKVSFKVINPEFLLKFEE